MEIKEGIPDEDDKSLLQDSRKWIDVTITSTITLLEDWFNFSTMKTNVS